jgi:hypothetical protein
MCAVYGFALITLDGIVFLDEAYSCRSAIKERWFDITDDTVLLAEVVEVSPIQQQIKIRYKGKIVVCNKLLSGIESTLLWLNPFPDNVSMMKKVKKKLTDDFDELQK